MIVIGSEAMMYWDRKLGGKVTRQPNDLDLIGTLDEIYNWARRWNDHIEYMIPTSPWKFKCVMKSQFQVEFEVADVNPSAKMLHDKNAEFELIRVPIPTKGGSIKMYVFVPDVEYLYMTKRSHVYWPVHWQKTMTDVTHLKKYAKNITQDHIDFYDLRLKENEAKFGKRFKANLNQTNEQFFAKSERAVKRQFEHDDLHEIVKYYDQPIYKALKVDITSALIDKEMFMNVDREVQLNAVREEAMVIALERIIIPGRDTDSVKAYQYAIMRICTNLTSGWFREFALDNWNELKDPDVDYVGLFKQASA